ncbi:phage tail protein [Cohnella sp. GCM10027633]|uniref:phage tail protein n=1 Tax=unclassified Cohnella TaxID=2636738 RepID=UPI003632A432
MTDGNTYYSLSQPEHWRKRGFGRNLDVASGVSLRTDAKYGVSATVHLGEMDGIGSISDFAVQSIGRWILLDDQGDLWSYDRGSKHHERLFVPGHGLFGPAAMLAVSGDTLFVADPTGTAMLSAIDLANGQLRWSRTGGFIDEVPIRPLAIAADDRHLYVLTPEEADEKDMRSPDGEAKLAIVTLSLFGNLEASVTDERFAAALPEDAALWRGNYYLAASTGGHLYALDSGGQALFAFDPGGRLANRLVLPSLPLAGLGVDSDNRIYIGDTRGMEEGAEDDRFLLQFGEEGDLQGRVAGFRGKTDGLLIDAKDRIYVRSRENGTITVLELQEKTRGWDDGGSPEGLWLSRAFDSGEAETIWHKFTLEADIPDGTQLRVSYFSSDSEWVTAQGSAWMADEWLAREDLSLKERADGLKAHWSAPVINPVDALFFGARGRYLWLKIEWIGSERRTPRLDRLRVYYPRETLLNYLPAVYREDEGSRDFLERYLSLYGTLFDSVEEAIDGMSRSFDRELVSGSRLRWLASWIGLASDEHWTDDWVRKLLRAAPDMYRYRGTRRGIELLVETLTGTPPVIVEPFQFKNMRDHAELRQLTDRLYTDDPHTFTLLLHPGQARSDKERVLLRGLVEEHKPAFTEVRIVWIQPWVFLDLHTYLGINTVLAEPSLFTINADRSMPNDTLIVDMDMDGRLDAHMRLGIDSEME